MNLSLGSRMNLKSRSRTKVEDEGVLKLPGQILYPVNDLLRPSVETMKLSCKVNNCQMIVIKSQISVSALCNFGGQSRQAPRAK